MKTLLAQGAESRLYREKDNVVKDRFPKAYRLKQIDDPLRKARTRREAKILEGKKNTTRKNITNKRMVIS